MVDEKIAPASRASAFGIGLGLEIILLKPQNNFFRISYYW